MGIISLGSNDFQPLAEKDYETIRMIRLILFICFVSQNNTLKSGPNTGLYMATSENFDVIFQNFILDDDHFADTAGEIVRMTKGGFNASDIKFQTPGYVLNPLIFRLDNNLFNIFLRIKKDKPLIFKKIMNATEIFIESYFNTPYLSRNARVLLQMSAFETLLGLPDRGQREAFKNYIENYASLPSDKKYESYWSKKERPASKPKEFLSIKGIWAEEFYLLRNSIIHGDTPPTKRFRFKNGQSHTDIAVLFRL